MWIWSCPQCFQVLGKLWELPLVKLWATLYLSELTIKKQKKKKMKAAFKKDPFWAGQCKEIKSSSCLIVMTFLAAHYIVACFFMTLQTGCGPGQVIFVWCDCLYSILYLWIVFVFWSRQGLRRWWPPTGLPGAPGGGRPAWRPWPAHTPPSSFPSSSKINNKLRFAFSNSS